MTLKEAIIKVVDDNSGGVKFITLLTEILKMNHEDPFEEFSDEVEIPYVISEELRRVSNLGNLEYLDNLKGTSKRFIYYKNDKKV